jgi:hypothetical protein
LMPATSGKVRLLPIIVGIATTTRGRLHAFS